MDFNRLSAADILTVIVVILISISVHEFMHAFVGFKLGDDTAAEQGRVSLNPFQHIDPVMTLALPVLTYIVFGAPILAAKPVPFNPERVKFGDYGAALLAAAGPLSNLAMAAIGAILANLIISGELLTTFLAYFVTINVSLFIFNLIPIPPLDGSRILYAFAPDGVRNAMNQLEPYGFVIILGWIILPGPFGLGSLLVNLNGQLLQLLS